MENDKTKQAEMPYFKLFIKDEIANLTLLGMDATEYGAFCIFRNLIWARGFLRFEKKVLAKILRISAKKFDEIWENISSLFSEIDGKLIIPELEIQRAKYNDFIEKSREGGKKSRSNVGSSDIDGGLDVPSSNSNLKENYNSKSKSENSELDSELNEKKGKESDVEKNIKKNGHANGQENRVRVVDVSAFYNKFLNYAVENGLTKDAVTFNNEIRQGKHNDSIIELVQSNKI